MEQMTLPPELMPRPLIVEVDSDPTPPHGIERPPHGVNAGVTDSDAFDVCGRPCIAYGSSLTQCVATGCAFYARGDE